MSRVVNSVDLDKVAQTAKTGKKDRSTLRKKVMLQGEWNLDPKKGYQFRTEMSYEKGKQAIEVDSPSYLGGNGNRLGPMAYCIAGIASCFISTFVTLAAMEGAELTGLKVNAQCDVNFAKTLDVADEPITEGIDFAIEASSNNADRERLQGLVRKTEERCPAIYSMSHVTRVSARIV
ncbi:MAG: OsmC family protein [Nitrososphaerota archaeon]|nr:OsmC family protein [Nitrososphaerota archaeon]MDG6973592.1 OsmC family protein [Nitrososphaerota archaeon]MDG6987376.1 OsmC family protein [Nitrososphaerota archaeon]